MTANSPTTMTYNNAFADLTPKTTVFMHDVTNIPRSEEVLAKVSHLDLYDRVNVLAAPHKNHVVLAESRIDPGFHDYLLSMGFGTPHVIVVPGEEGEPLTDRVIHNAPYVREQLEHILGDKISEAEVSSYFGSPKDELAAKMIGLPLYANPKTANILDDKIEFRRFCENLQRLQPELGLELVPDEEEFYFTKKTGQDIRDLAQEVQRCLESPHNNSGKAIIRGRQGSSGSSIYIIEGMDMERIEMIAERMAQSAFTMGQTGSLIAPFITGLESPGATYMNTRDGRTFHMSTNGQILSLNGVIKKDGKTHEGSRSLDSQEYFQRISTLGYHIAQMFASMNHRDDNSFVGPLGIDFLGEYPIECNPRNTGQSYPFAGVINVLEKRHGPFARARSQNLYTARTDLNFDYLRFQTQDFMYDGDRKAAMYLPYNQGPMQHGKFSVAAVADSQQHMDSLFHMFETMGIYQDEARAKAEKQKQRRGRPRIFDLKVRV